MRFTTLLLSVALLLVATPVATATEVATVCGEYTTEDGDHYDDAITIATPEGVRTSDGDATDEVDDAALDIAAEATDGDEKTTGNGYLDVTTGDFSETAKVDVEVETGGTDRLNLFLEITAEDQGQSVGTDNVLWDSDGDGDAVEPNDQGHADCRDFQDDDAA